MLESRLPRNGSNLIIDDTVVSKKANYGGQSVRKIVAIGNEWEGTEYRTLRNTQGDRKVIRGMVITKDKIRPIREEVANQTED